MRTRTAGYTMIEIAIVVAVISLLTAISIPSYGIARKNSKKNTCLNNLRQIAAAVDQWSVANSKGPGDPYTWTDILPYLKGKSVCPAGGVYEAFVLGSNLHCTVHEE
jgi:prepilin-type N-terminal cleavage/methylation domain-containing protein